ncbi:MAG TPA: hypothetical protein VNE61_00605 [Ktedonobacteraceae bacterium]|nr:hypothetical protein [Ktedonobacteraceae bacterium]
MKKTLLARLQRNGRYFITGALLLLLGVPVYQYLLLIPQGYSNAQAAIAQNAFLPYLYWIANHVALFLGSRLLLVLAFLVLVSLPFTLFRVIIAQELIGSEDANEQAQDDNADNQDKEDGGEDESADDEEEQATAPAEAWRGKGYAVIAAWTGMAGIAFFLLGTLASAIYFAVVAGSLNPHSSLPGSFLLITAILTIIANTAGDGLIGLSCFFFGIVIARRGTRLWPGIWIAFGYAALPVAALLIIAALSVASAPTQAQGALATLSVLLFALWVLWLGVMLASLKAET